MKQFLFIVHLCCFQLINAQLKETNFENIEIECHNKPTVIYIYADWCKYCHAMESSTFQNKEVINLLNKNYNFIKFNAEHKDQINLFDKEFVFKPTGKNAGVHSLAQALGAIDGKLEFPTTVVLNANYEIVFQYASMLQTNDLILILNSILKNEKF